MVLANLTSVAPVFAQDASKGSAENGASPSTATSKGGNTLEEILVTAQRRTERLIDVPYNISAVSGADLATSGVTSVADLTKLVAGLGNFSDGPSDRYGQNNFTMRGLSTDSLALQNKYTAASVATYYGDTPVFYPILLKDLERVEVLRGPQGTLYGSSAESGAIRFIPKRPSFDKLSSEVNVSTGTTQNASRLNGSADGVINIPLAENLAVRVSAAYVNQAGFVDQVNLFMLGANNVPVPRIAGDLTSGPVIAPIQKGTNNTNQWMVRGAARYQPTDWLDLDVSYLHQETHADDTQLTNPDYVGGVRDLSYGTYANGSYTTRPGGRYANTQSILQPLTSKLDIVSATAAFDLGFAELSSISSYYKTQTNSTQAAEDGYIVPAYNLLPYYNFYPRFTADRSFRGQEKGFTQEVRLVSNGQSRFSYVLGAYYERRNKRNVFDYLIPGLQALSNSPACRSAFGNFFCGPHPSGENTYYATQGFVDKDRAIFGELTYQLTPEWQVTGGARAFKDSQDFDQRLIAYWFGSNDPYKGSVGASGKVFKVNTSYQLNADNLVYFTYSEGFRRGGANAVPPAGNAASLPKFLAFQPDFSNNFEIGIKGSTLDRRLTYSLTAFDIKLKDFQFNGTTPGGFSAVFNGASAQSRGLEFEGSFRATPQLTLSASYALTRTKVPETTVIRDLAAGSLITNPPNGTIIVSTGATVLAGAVLPGVSKNAATAAIDYEVPLRGGARLMLHTNGNYRSSQTNTIAEGAFSFRVLPSVFTADARITYDSGKGWSGSVFATNLTNSFNSTGDRGVQSPSPAFASLPRIYAGQTIGTPRTFGVSLHYGF
jgi:outer membrane receptor protein involved in Fe transport